MCTPDPDDLTTDPTPALLAAELDCSLNDQADELAARATSRRDFLYRVAAVAVLIAAAVAYRLT
jgi:hypothetical protein